MHPFQRMSAWVLVVLGSVLLLSGTAGFVDALVHRRWGAALLTAALLVVVAFGTMRGVRQLRRGRPRG